MATATLSNAQRVARRHYGSIDFLVARISIENALNLQNPAIRPLFTAFCATFDRRLAHLGVQVEPNDNASYYRPVSHLTIEAFRRTVEAISGRAFDVLSARFALKGRDIDVELPHEICVKRSRAILSVERRQSVDENIFPSSDPATWPCAHATVQAAQDAVRVIGFMDDRDLLDLILSIYQGSEGCWHDTRPRFVDFGPIHFLHDSRQFDRAPDLAQAISETGHRLQRTIRSFDLAMAARTGTPRAQRLVSGFMESTAGIVALLAPGDTEVVSLLVTVAERRPEVPILAMLTPLSKGDIRGEFKAPIVLRSRHNLCCVRLPRTEVACEFVKGFLHDRWTDALAVLDIESKMAARHGSTKARHRDARKIVEAYHARQLNLL
jgi:hypothetical protein